jgi:hypothetical protein
MTHQLCKPAKTFEKCFVLLHSARNVLSVCCYITFVPFVFMHILFNGKSIILKLIVGMGVGWIYLAQDRGIAGLLLSLINVRAQ